MLTPTLRGQHQHGNNKIVKSEDWKISKRMKYKNVDIGDKPTKEQFQEYISRKGYNIDVDYWYNKYDAKGWLTKKKTPIKSLETIINVINGIVIRRRKSNRDTNTVDILPPLKRVGFLDASV